jgi:hypothetical protein
MAPPTLMPVEPKPTFDQRLQHQRHLNGDGSICLIRLSSDWTGEGSAADFVQKAAAWFIEWLALEAGLIDRMSETGLYAEQSLDQVLEEYQ